MSIKGDFRKKILDSMLAGIQFYSGPQLDTWNGNGPLASQFLDLFISACPKSSPVVGDCIKRLVENVVWGPIFRRSLSKGAQFHCSLLLVRFTLPWRVVAGDCGCAQGMVSFLFASSSTIRGIRLTTNPIASLRRFKCLLESLLLDAWLC